MTLYAKQNNNKDQAVTIRNDGEVMTLYAKQNNTTEQAVIILSD